MKMKSTTMMPTEKKEEMTTHEEIRTTKMNPQKMTTKVIGSETNSPSAKENFSTTTTTPVIGNFNFFFFFNFCIFFNFPIFIRKYPLLWREIIRTYSKL